MVSVLCYSKLCALFQSHQWIQTWVTVQKRSIRVKICDFFVPHELDIWRMNLKNNWTPFLCYFKLYVSFHSHRSIQTWVTIRVKIDDVLSLATLKFNGWPWKTIGHLFYATSSSMYHFIAIDQFKLELQSGNAQFGSKSTIFCPMWPWDLTDDLEKQ